MKAIKLKILMMMLRAFIRIIIVEGFTRAALLMLILIIGIAYLFTWSFAEHEPVEQELNMYPLSILDTYNNGTRNKLGKPGDNYWQNKTRYQIEVEVDMEQKKIVGSASMTYFNYSPDTLKEVWFNIHSDFYKKGNIKDRSIKPSILTEGVEIKNLTVRGQDYDLENSEQVLRENTNMQVFLPDVPLSPKDSVHFVIEWQEAIPHEHVTRTGLYDSTTVFMGYWYPQIAVYDDIEGWDMLNYAGLHEFYRDFSDYEVHITIPESYLIWATGTLQNPKEIYAEAILEKLEAAQKSDATLCVVEGKADYPPTSSKQKTWVYKANNVADFAFAFSNHFRWEANSLEVEGALNGRVLINNVYPSSYTSQLSQITQKQRDIMQYFSEEFPAIPYPYEHFTTFIATPRYTGMEFPMMANNGASEELLYAPTFQDIRLSAHEIAHTYFPFYVGTNERRHAWMDEGWAMFFTTKLLSDEASPLKYPSVPRKNILLNRFLNREGTMYSPPMMTTSSILAKRPSHRHLSYVKPYMAYSVLEDMMGKDLFRKCIRTYMLEWAFKRPMPYDFFYTINRVSGQNLNWFWKPWFQEFVHADLGLSFNEDDELIVQNVGGLPLPFFVELIYRDGSKEVIRQKVNVWENQNVFTVITQEDKVLESAKLLTNIWPDMRKENNTIN